MYSKNITKRKVVYPMKKKIIAPLIIAVIMILYYLINGFFFITATSGFIPVTFFMVALLSYFIFKMIQVTKERLHEIKNEDDDLHKY